jgi:hypothetical protein
MAVRKPLYEVSGNLREMSTAMVDSIVDQVIYQYSLNPSVALSVVSSGGNLGTITDTRKQAGVYSWTQTAFPSEATTAEPSTVTVSYSKINSSTATVSPTTDTGKTWPSYYNASGQIQAMNLQDVKDTFLHPAIDLLTAATTTTQQAGTYFISTSSSVSGATLISATPVFSDTRANTGAYTAAGIPETLDQPTTVTNYYLHRVNGSAPSFTLPYYIDGSNHIHQYTSATFNSLVQEWIRYTAASSADGYSISYNLGTSGSGNTRGSGMGDTILNGSGNYQTLYVNTDDYRAQEFPNGTAVTANTYYLRINKS